MQDIGWAQHWTCNPADGGCGTTHQRDDNAAINLARYEDTDTASDSAVGPVGAAVKRGADRKTRPGRAGGREARKGRGHQAAEQPRDGCLPDEYSQSLTRRQRFDNQVRGLRDRKKVQTREAIRREAMRLIKEDGYANTTVEQIAEAAEVSPSTFFRYFPSKEMVLMANDLDLVTIEALGQQPAEMP